MNIPDRTETARKAAALRAMHVPGSPVVMPNAWDPSSAKVIAEAGFEALATTSGGVAEALGYADGEKTPSGEMFDAVARIAGAVEVPVTADVERGYGLAPEDIVEGLVRAGAVGCNLEDSDAKTRALIPAVHHADWLTEVRAAAERARVPIVINARIDVHLRKAGEPETRLAQAVERARFYLEAWADCVYPIFLNDPDELREFVAQVRGPVNSVFLPGGPSIAELTSCGIARITYGSGLHDASLAWLSRALGKISRGQDPY
jgi:2-methylisocitrate lyase-like PEP mutase family enzyme